MPPIHKPPIRAIQKALHVDRRAKADMDQAGSILVRAQRFDANQRPRGQCLIGLEWRGRTIVAVTHQERRYLPTGRTATRPTGESVIEMMARDDFVERLWLKTDGTILWEQQPLAL